MCQYVSVRVLGYLQSEITQGLQLLRHECGQTGAEPGGGRSANSYPILATITMLYPVHVMPCKEQAS